MWLDGCTDYLSSCRSECRPDSHRNAHRDTDSNALTFGKPIAQRQRLT
jgi:hypothetical protein